MKDSNKTNYDVIIIGAGIGGLTCGCYLAKAGLKTLIVEKSYQPGGYCTSFTRGGYFFDACVCSLSGLGNGGSIHKLIKDFSLGKSLNIRHFNIPDRIIIPHGVINLYSDIDLTLSKLQKQFPKEKKSLALFFSHAFKDSIVSCMHLRNISFSEMINNYLINSNLKTALSIVLFGYTGVNPMRMSALAACLFFRDFIFNGGYYPIGGLQNFSNTIANKFSQLGGNLLLSSTVQEIGFSDNRVQGLVLENNERIVSKCVVSACDMHQTFFNLIDKSYVPSKLLNRIGRRKESLSAFIVYLGLKKKPSYFSKMTSHVWSVSRKFDFAKIYSDLLQGKPRYVGITSSSLKNNSFLSKKKSKNSLFLYVNMPFVSKDFWNQENKDKMADRLIENAEKYITNLTSSIDSKIIASPRTLYNWTNNYKGAAYGWADTVDQFADPNFLEKTSLKGLYLTGHWLNRSSGVSPVVHSGHCTAKRIMSDWKKIFR